MAASEDSQNDRTQLNVRVEDCESRLDSVEGAQARDHEDLVKLRTEYTAHREAALANLRDLRDGAEKARDKREGTMLQTIMLFLTAAISLGAGLLTAFKK